MKKIIKIILIIFASFVLVETVAWVSAVHFIRKNYPEYNNFPVVSPFIWRPVQTFDELYKKLETSLFRKPVGLQYKSRPVVIFGCSFAYGDKLSNKQTLSYKLSNYAKRPVYNRAYPGWGPQHMLWQLQNEPALDNIKNPKFVIYVFINDHIRRIVMRGQINSFLLFNPYNLEEYLSYKIKQGRLVQVHDAFPILRHTVLANLIMYGKSANIWNRSENDRYRKDILNLLKLHFLESKKIAAEKWPNAKFIILHYDTVYGITYGDFWDQIQKEGFIYINSKQAFGVSDADLKYKQSEVDPHPSEYSWDVIVPRLAKKLDSLR